MHTQSADKFTGRYTKYTSSLPYMVISPVCKTGQNGRLPDCSQIAHFVYFIDSDFNTMWMIDGIHVLNKNTKVKHCF